MRYLRDPNNPFLLNIGCAGASVDVALDQAGQGVVAVGVCRARRHRGDGCCSRCCRPEKKIYNVQNLSKNSISALAHVWSRVSCSSEQFRILHFWA